jgi:streptomycin 6-kinase
MNLFEQNITKIYGTRGKDWLASLPKISADLAAQWHVTDIKPFSNLTFHYVVRGMQYNRPVVIKMRIDGANAEREAAALRCYAGSGSVKLLEFSKAQGALLLESVQPGTVLKNVCKDNEDAAIGSAAAVIKKMHSAVRSRVDLGYQFPTVSEWLTVLDKDLGLPKEFVMMARQLADELLLSSQDTLLLHGDLHHGNILKSERGQFLAIDPKGVIGDPVFELGAFIRNPMPELLAMPQVSQVIEHRIEKFAQLLDFDAQRIRQWSYVTAVMAAAWAVEDNMNPDQWLAVAQLLKK